jgi:hypothetical protein
MDFIEANEIFNNWRQWYWPCHFILWTVFFVSGIPESFLLYPINVLEEALNIVAKSYWDKGDRKNSDLIKSGIGSLASYEKDEEAFKWASKNFSNPNMMKAIHFRIEAFKKDWTSWLEKQEK